MLIWLVTDGAAPSALTELAWMRPTFPARLPLLRIDHVFVSRGVAVRGVRTLGGRLARVASDHLPLVADLNLAPSVAPELSAPDISLSQISLPREEPA